ncbi:MAG: DNA mismatch repair protein MutS, partial [Alphaproteobacteria bacterium]
MTAENNTKITPMMLQYLEVKEKHKDYLLMYRMGDFYELFFEDAEIASKALDIALTHRGTYLGKQIPMCGVPHHAFSSYMPKLIKQGYKVAICDQTETPEEAKLRGGNKAVIKREVSRIITAGTLTEDNLLNSSLNNYLCSVYAKDGLEPHITIAIADISTGEFLLQNWDTNAISELQSFLLIKNPVEIIISEKLLTNKKFENIIGEHKQKLVIKPESFFDTINAQKNLCEQFQIATLDSIGNFTNEEISCCGAILNYINITQIGTKPNLNYPSKEKNSDFLQIDAFSIKNLEIFNNINDENIKDSSLFEILDKTQTSLGRRLLRQILSTPLANTNKINERLNIVEFFTEHTELLSQIREELTLISDIQRIISRITLNRAGPKDLQNLAFSLQQSSYLKEELENELKNTITNPLSKILEGLKDFTPLSKKLKNAIIDEAPLTTKDAGFIKEGFNVTLDEYKNIQQNTKQIILDLQSKYILDTGISNLKIKYNNIVGYFIEVPLKQATSLMGNKTYTHRQTLVNNVRFSTTELTEIEQKILVANEKYVSLELSLFKELCTDILNQTNDIEKFAESIANLDVFTNLALIATENNYTKPLIDDSLAFEIIDGRHPVVEANIKKQNATFIPNDCVLENTKDSSKLWILTGPNMAGKSTFLRQNAIIIIMAQIGSFVPATSAHIGVVNKLFSRVGASDNLARGQSTFMVEMSETATILNQADEHSFVILDEIGRGTAT